MRKRLLLLVMLVLLCSQASGGIITGTVRNMTSFEGNLTVAALGIDMTDMMGAPMETTIRPTFPFVYTLDDSSIVNFSPYFVIAFMHSMPFPIPVSGNPFGVHPNPVIPIRGRASNVNIVLWADGDIGGTITWDGDFNRVYINVYDALAFGRPALESTHRIRDRNYFIGRVPAGPKRIQAFVDLNRNGRYDEGEPQGYAYMSVVGFDTPLDMIMVTGTNAASGTDITIRFPEGIDEHKHPAEIRAEVSPNPAYSDFVIDYDLSGERGELVIYDLEGRIVRKRDIQNAGQIRVNGLDGGTYIYNISTSATQKQGRIFIFK